MSQTTKPLSDRDMSQAIRGSFNDSDKSLTTSGFVSAKVGHKITQTISTTSVFGDTSQFDYFDNGTLLYSLKVIYTDGTQSVMISAERIA